MSGAAFHKGTSKTDYPTPWPFVNAVDKRFGPITYDLAAHHGNTRCRSYFTPEQNSLIQNWHRIPGLLWLNPPYDHIKPWAEKCSDEMDKGARIAFLVPAAVGSIWFEKYVFARALVLFIRPRLSFDGEHGYPKDLLLAVYGQPAGFALWNWDPKAPRKAKRAKS